MKEENQSKQISSKYTKQIEDIIKEKKQIDLELEKIYNQQKEVKNQIEKNFLKKEKLISQINEIKKEDAAGEIDWKTIGLIAGGLILLGGSGGGFGLKGGKCGTRSAK